MGCICKNNKNEIIIEAKTEYKTDLINFLNIKIKSIKRKK